MSWKKTFRVGAIVASAAVAGTALAETIDPAFQEMAMFGINASNGQLKRYNFDNSTGYTVGTIKDKQGNPLLNINGAAYIPGHSNIVGFWKNASGQTRMVYVDTETANGTMVGEAMGSGRISGAVAAPNGISTVGGIINVNPDSSAKSEFILRTDGDNTMTITTSDLKSDVTVDANGTLYMGKAYYMRVAPKGNGSQNGLTLDGDPYVLDNGHRYAFTGPMIVRLYNDDLSTGKPAGHWWVEFIEASVNIHVDGNMIAGGATGKSPWAVYALQDVATSTATTINFAIQGDSVVPSVPFAAKATVLGSAISYEGQYDMPVTMKFAMGGVSHMPFGDFSLAVDGNVNDDRNPRSHVFSTTFPAGTRIDTVAKSWIKTNNGNNGKKNSHWQSWMGVDATGGDSPQLMVLRHGDAVPAVPGFQDQTSLSDYIKDYVDHSTNTMKLGKNDAIFLFELGTTDLTSSAADFQDLVVLVSLGATTAELTGDVQDGRVARLIKVNHITGGYSQLLGLQNRYDGLATLDGGTFYATKGQQLYVLSLADQTETLVGSSPADQTLGLEFAGTTLMGFENVGDKLVPIDKLTGAALGAAANVGMADLGTIVFMPQASDPAKYPVSYD